MALAKDWYTGGCAMALAKGWYTGGCAMALAKGWYSGGCAPTVRNPTQLGPAARTRAFVVAGQGVWRPWYCWNVRRTLALQLQARLAHASFTHPHIRTPAGLCSWTVGSRPAPLRFP
eukprot:366259-Chlamydomonas_euryale.AAC.23